MLCKIVVLVSKEAHQFAIGAVGREVLALGFLLDAHGYLSVAGMISTELDLMLQVEGQQQSCCEEETKTDFSSSSRPHIIAAYAGERCGFTVVFGGHTPNTAIHWPW
jgi:hypothetical protein